MIIFVFNIFINKLKEYINNNYNYNNNSNINSETQFLKVQLKSLRFDNRRFIEKKNLEELINRTCKLINENETKTAFIKIQKLCMDLKKNKIKNYLKSKNKKIKKYLNKEAFKKEENKREKIKEILCEYINIRKD